MNPSYIFTPFIVWFDIYHIPGLLPAAHPYVDKFDHWPENSKKNKDLLYGTARHVISAKYTGIGDT